MTAAKEELADVMIYLLRLTDVLHINLEEAVNEKIALNEAKCPVDVSRGNATKYNRR
jgi:NTP pyrophosphatase (non-canonical NTP hydrolase)